MTHSFQLSVVIPAYNAESTLGRALESVVSQTCLAKEIVVVDDGSTDATAKVAADFGSAVKFFRKENGGASSARNFGISKCQHEWIAFLDSDDVWLPNHNQNFRDLLWSHPELNWAFGRYEIEKDQQRLRLSSLGSLTPNQAATTGHNALQLLATGCSIWTSAVVVRKSCLEEVGGFDERQKTSHDTDLWFRLAVAYQRIGFASEPVAKYNVGNADSLTGLAAAGQDETWILSIERYLKAAETLKPKDQEWVAQFVRFKSNQKLRNTIKGGNTKHAKWLLREYQRLNINGIDRRYRLLASLPPTLLGWLRRLLLLAKGSVKPAHQNTPVKQPFKSKELDEQSNT